MESINRTHAPQYYPTLCPKLLNFWKCQDPPWPSKEGWAPGTTQLLMLVVALICQSAKSGGDINTWAAEPTYGRDDEFRPTFISGTEKRLFSVGLLMTWCLQNAPNCTDLHQYFPRTPNIPWFPPWLARPPSHFFRVSAAAVSIAITMQIFSVRRFWPWPINSWPCLMFVMPFQKSATSVNGLTNQPTNPGGGKCISIWSTQQNPQQTGPFSVFSLSAQWRQKISGP